MSDLIEEYEKSGLISDPTTCFMRCDVCGERFHPDDLTTTVVLEDGSRATLEVCDGCSAYRVQEDYPVKEGWNGSTRQNPLNGVYSLP